LTTILQPVPKSSLDWYALKPIWQGDELAVQRGLPHTQLSPVWQIWLLGDGSPTRNLQLLTGAPIHIDLIDMSPIGTSSDGAPAIIQHVPGPRLRRQVWLKSTKGENLAYAASWWQASHVDDYLRDRSIPIWESLADLRTELYRDVRGIEYGHSSELEDAFGYPGPFWGRYYLFWHRREPLTLIYEVFSPALTAHLGPQ
jgi:chorismate lyase